MTNLTYKQIIIGALTVSAIALSLGVLAGQKLGKHQKALDAETEAVLEVKETKAQDAAAQKKDAPKEVKK